MKCPKCHYISFDEVERCRNCGYDFALGADPRAPAGSERPETFAELPLQGASAGEGLASDLPLATGAPEPPPKRPRAGADRRVPEVPGPNDLPLFDAPVSGVDDTPLITAPAAPRAPLSVRRSTVEPGRPPAPEPPPAPSRRRGLAATAEPVAHDRRAVPERPPIPSADSTEEARGEEAPGASVAVSWRRAVAALVDALLLGAIDLAVIDLTLRVAGLDFGRIAALPPVPLVAFLLVLNGGYLVGFTTAAGQTIGKMLTGVQVVAATTRRVPLGQAIVRAASTLLTAATLGVGYLPAFMGRDRRALHDRLAGTRVQLR